MNFRHSYFSNSLAGRLSGWLILLVTIIFGTATTIDYFNSKDHVLQEAKLKAQEVVKDSVYELETMLYGVGKSTDQLGLVLGYSSITPQLANRLLVDLIETNDDLSGAVIALQPEFTVGTGAYANYVYRDGGKVFEVDLTEKTKAASAYLEFPWYVEAKKQGKPVWSEPYLDEHGSQNLMVTYAVPIYQQSSPLLFSGSSNLFVGVVTGNIALSRIKRFLDQIQVADTGYAFLTSQQGLLLSYPDEDHIFTPIIKLFSRLTPNDSASSRQWREMVDVLMSSDQGVVSGPCIQSESKCLYGHAPLGFTDWPFVVVITEDEFLKPIRDYLIRVIALGSLTLILLLISIHYVTRRVISPLSELSRLVGRIGEGDLTTVLPKSKEKDEVHTLVNAVNSMQSHLKQYIRSLEKETALTARLKGEMDAATSIQMSMLPGEGRFSVHGRRYHMSAMLESAKSVGGDLYFYYPLDDERSYFVIGDVSDKGVPAALFMAKTITLLNQLVSQQKTPAELLYDLNNELEKNNESCMFVTLWCGILDQTDLSLTYASGGHMAPMIIKTMGNNETVVDEADQENGLALGLMSDVEFPENRLVLSEGDALFVYTDGVDEAQDDTKRMFGVERLEQALTEAHSMASDDMVKHVYNSVKTFADDSYQSDDITVMSIRVKTAVASQEGTRC